MAAKRRRSRGGGADAIGCAPILALVVIGLIIQYWWVLLIALGVVAMTVALVRVANAPPHPNKVSTPKPQPVMTPRRPVPGGDDLADQMRANKQVRRIRDMQEWDYEWIRLTHPGKSVREVNEIAIAFFARGWSVGVNSEGPTTGSGPNAG
ncbi:hypothetical protein FBY31_0738 [Arthrobacter sp. SLBN-100]|uniref:hypothetical protein n=1 Tax=Arthrobacter sp. SLBN-100 TaxID=2768450 RepID=UPI00114EAAA9|nr:hypothetical protein [Arthrobacter sp. SLBN-100]TQJ66698.1 hypothetical protein FBY31_0738 [Arthrobacter sp. SLBN-100]